MVLSSGVLFHFIILNCILEKLLSSFITNQHLVILIKIIMNFDSLLHILQ